MLEDIDAFYADSHVLHRVSLRLGEGRLLGLLGRNGAGKSTSMSVTVGLLPPRGGRVAVFGHLVTGRAPETIAARGVALVPQGRRVFPSLTVRENLVVAARRPRGAAGRPWTLETVAELFPHLHERRDQLAASLSGGEQQMLAIGRALLTQPAVLMLDEATEGLAPLVRVEIWRTLAALKTSGQSVLIVDRDLDALAKLADRFAVMEKGRVALSGTNQELHTRRSEIERFIHV